MKRITKILAPSIVAAFVAVFVLANINGQVLANHDYEDENTPSPSVSASPTPTATPTPSPTFSPSPSPTPSATPSPSPSPTPTATPTPTIVPSPTPTVTTGGNTNINTNENKQEQTQTQINNQTVNITVNQATASGQVLSKTIVKQPETGVGVLGFATMLTSAPVGLFLARFRKGRINSKNLSNSEFATSAFEQRLQKQSDLG